MNRLTVGLNLLWLVPGDVGGSEQSTLATVRGLLERTPDDLDLRLFVLPSFAAAYPGVVAARPTAIAPTDGASRARRVLAESTWLARHTRSLDLVHHAGGTVPARRSAPCVLTLHDIQPLQARPASVAVPQATHSPLKRAYLSRAVPAAVAASRRVAVPSEFVRRTVLDLMSVPAEQVVVIPHAVPGRPAPTSASELIARFELTGPLVLYAAITYPHKDHQLLVEAFAQVLARFPDALLVLPGAEGGAETQVAATIAGCGLARSVRRLGRVSEADLAGLLTLAQVVAVPSRYEGFGLPALEAMAAGVPVVASDATSLPEVVGDAGVLVPPGDLGAWASAIGRLLGDATERDRLGRAGRARAARYSPAANAEAFANLYRAALARG